ncbi:MAG: type VI protein secretion system component VasK [Gammaproteobacteria bacterium]
MGTRHTLNVTLIAVTCTLVFIPQLALAYVGPGAGLSLLGALWGLIVGVVMALGIVLFWPIRMMLRKRKAAAEARKADTPEAHTPPPAASAEQGSDQTP